jgi:L-asparaginase
MTGKPRVAVFALGGTIASSNDSSGAATVQLTGPELLSGIPQAGDIADVEAHSVRMVPSGDLRLADLIELQSLVDKAIRSGADGVVVSQGTDTLEETAYAFELLTALDAPVVFTGAMRNSSIPGSDGPANLLAAIRVAASSEARGLGTVVVFNDEIHASRHVRKRHTSSTATFGSPLTGPLGHLTEERVRILTRPNGRLHIRVPQGAADVRVAQVTTFFDDDGRLIDVVPSLGYRGLVLAAFGGGHVPSWTVPILRKVAGQIPVVVASRTNAGEGLLHTYAYPGSEVDLFSKGDGLIPAVGVDTAHAAVLLRLLLMAGVEPGSLRWCFEQAGDPRGLVTIPPTGGVPHE